MPKVNSGATTAAASGPALRRNQACRQCRKRKLKCNAQKPHCATCVKQWNAQIAVPPPIGFSHPSQPLCTYDHMDGLTLAPADQVVDPEERARILEKQISDLQAQLSDALRESGAPSSLSPPHLNEQSVPKSNLNVPLLGLEDSQNTPIPNQNARFQMQQESLQPHHQNTSRPSSSSSRRNSASGLGVMGNVGYGNLPSDNLLTSGGPTSTPSTSLTTASSHNFGGRATKRPNNGIQKDLQDFPGNVDIDIDTELRLNPPELDGFGNLPDDHMNQYGPSMPDSRAVSLQLYHESFPMGSPNQSPREILFSGWNPDLPEPRLLRHLVSLYFTRDTCASRILHRPSFLLAMNLPPTHPDFPHPAILHAICASASRWTLRVGERDVRNGGRDRFAEYHAGKTRSYIDQTIATGQNIFSVLMAGIVLSWWFYHEGRWVEVWSHAGFLTRVSIPLGLNFPGTHPTHSAASPYLAAPSNPTDLEQRRRAWWMCLAFDRIVSVGGWPHSIDERDIGTELPLKREDFEAENPVPSNPQDLASENMLTRHNPLYTDPFILFIKACMLFGKVTDYNTRMVNLRHHPRSPNPLGNTLNATFKSDPRMAAGFRGVDRLVAVDFLANLPTKYNSCLGVQTTLTSGSNHIDVNGTTLDTDLYMVHIIPHAATITLHNPYINFSDPQCPSAARCLTAARAILNAYYLITSTSFDIKRLHPFITICWYLAAVVLVQACKRLIETGDRSGEGTVWGEINLMRYASEVNSPNLMLMKGEDRLAMLEYGSVSPIGVRQEKLLQGLMSEILRMTTQAQPLAVGVPLYPFSRQSLYDPTFQPSATEVVETSISNMANGQMRSSIHSAPLPNPASYDSADNSGTLGVQSMNAEGGSHAMLDLGGLTSFGLSNAFGPSMVSSQGIWHTIGESESNNGMGNGSDAMDIFGQLGF